MKVSPPSSSAHLLLLVLPLLLGWAPVQGQSEFFRTNAQSIDDLYYVLGPNFKLFVAAYWRYLITTCDIVQERMSLDVENGRIKRFCPYLVACPTVATSQSCIVFTSALSVWNSCCSEPPRILTTPSPQEPRTTIKAPLVFDLKAQHACEYGTILPSEKIFGGTPTKPGEFPWVAMLLKNGSFTCACSILDAKHVVTSAHCFDFYRDSDVLEIVAGKYTSDVIRSYDNEQRLGVTSFVKHELYDQRHMVNDIAILELTGSLIWTPYVMPVCLPYLEDQLEQSCTVAGWGKTETQSESTVLLKTVLKAYTKEECLETFKDSASLSDFLFDGSICAANGLEGGKDSCRGDSGGPLMCVKPTATGGYAYFVFGIVSNGNGCAVPGEPGVYTYVPYYLDWIEHTIQTMS